MHFTKFAFLFICSHVLVNLNENRTLYCNYINFLLIVCKLLTVELQDALEKTGRSKEVLEVGEVLDTGKRRRKIKYNTSYVMITH